MWVRDAELDRADGGGHDFSLDVNHRDPGSSTVVEVFREPCPRVFFPHGSR
jgi:hypothetical protein